MGWWSQIWIERTRDWICEWLDPSQVPDPALAGEVERESAYLNIFLKSARVVNVRKGLKKFYGAVHSFMEIPHRSQQRAQFNVVTTPEALRNVDAGNVDRVVSLNHRLLGPVPFVGGDLEIQVGLFSIASSDLAAPYLSLLESLSKTAGVSFVSAALPFAGPIVEGVKLLAGSDKDSILEIGLSDTQSRPRQGYLIAIRASREELGPKTLKVDPSNFHLLDARGAPLTNYPYFVLEVRAERERSDWFEIPELKDAYKQIQELYRADKRSDTEQALNFFRRIALTCNDLQTPDAELLANKVDKMYRTFVPNSTRSAQPGFQKRPENLPNLSDLRLFATLPPQGTLKY